MYLSGSLLSYHSASFPSLYLCFPAVCLGSYSDVNMQLRPHLHVHIDVNVPNASGSAHQPRRGKFRMRTGFGFSLALHCAAATSKF